MALSGTSAVDEGHEYEEPLLNNISSDGGHQINSSNSFVEDVVDYRGDTMIERSNYGGWRSASFIIGTEIGETVANYGIGSNLINYLTGPLCQSTVVAAANINVWAGVMWMLPLLGAFVADSYLGRFHTILFSSLIYVLGLGLITLSVLLPSHECTNNTEINNVSSTSFQVVFFFFSLYLVAIGKAGFKPCAEAFGADQFDGRNPEESESKSSFFNWWYYGLCVGSIFSLLILTYIQDNLSWALGFGIPCTIMAVALLVFLFGRKTYRYTVKEDKENPILRISQVFVAATKNWRTLSSSSKIQFKEATAMPPRIRLGAHQFKFLDKALIVPVGSMMNSKPCTLTQVEDAKVVLRLVPIWLTCLMYAVVHAQAGTFFTKQGGTMDRSIGLDIQIPPASLHVLISLSVIVFMPIYDRVFIPLAQTLSGKPNGITMLQRIGAGMVLSTLCMAVAAIVEKRRLQISAEFGLIDMPNVTVPMSVWWLVPQYFLIGLTEILTMVGLQEFFYDQVPDGLRSMGLSIYLSVFGTGNFLSGFLISAIDKLTSGSDQYSWFPDNLNRAHLDYFYWLLAGLSAIDLVVFVYFTKSYLYNREASM